MRQLMYHLLLVLAVGTAGMLIYHNLAMRPDYGVTVVYSYPESGLDEGSQVDLDDGFASASGQQEAWEEAAGDQVVVLAEFPLELNCASVEELTYVPRIGDVTAQRIVQYRQVLGGYTSLEQLMEIKGIGDATFQTIEPYLYLEEQAPLEGEQELSETS